MAFQTQSLPSFSYLLVFPIDQPEWKWKRKQPVAALHIGQPSEAQWALEGWRVDLEGHMEDMQYNKLSNLCRMTAFFFN